MNDLRALLRNGDPIAREGKLSPADSERMRRRLQSEDVAAPPARSRFFPATAVALLLLVTGAAWVVTSRVVPPPAVEERTLDVATGPREPVGTLRLQFVTPGGTRVFWTFHPRLETR